MKFSLIKKKIEPAWHPNFVNGDRLPDVKLIRTNFLLNFVGVSCALLLSFYFMAGLLSTTILRFKLGELEDDIAFKQPQNEHYIKQSNLFAKESKTLNFFKDFFVPFVDPVQLLVVISENYPEEIQFNSISFSEKDEGSNRKRIKNKKKNGIKREYTLTIEGSIAGSYDDALDQLNNYKDKLSELSEIKPLLKDIEIKNLSRDPELGIFTYQLDILLQPTS